jgi:hypothetical protein
MDYSITKRLIVRVFEGVQMDRSCSESRLLGRCDIVGVEPSYSATIAPLIVVRHLRVYSFAQILFNTF